MAMVQQQIRVAKKLAVVVVVNNLVVDSSKATKLGDTDTVGRSLRTIVLCIQQSKLDAGLDLVIGWTIVIVVLRRHCAAGVVLQSSDNNVAVCDRRIRHENTIVGKNGVGQSQFQTVVKSPFRVNWWSWVGLNLESLS